MIKKILCIVLAVLLLFCLGGGILWKLNEARWREEYLVYKKSAAPILMYHAVGLEEGSDWPANLIMKPDLFESHLRYLKEQGYNIVTVAELAERLQQGDSVDKYIALSFDDGYKNNYSVVLPVLQKYNAKGSFFVINKDLGDAEHMNEQEIKALIDAGMELGSHTYTHNPLAKIEEKYLVWELDTSRYWLKKKFDGYIVRTLAYPNGSYNSKVIAAAKKYGFYRALTGHIGVNTATTYAAAPMEMYRVTVADDGNGLAGFKKRLEQAYFFGFLQTKGFDINVIRDLFVQ